MRQIIYGVLISMIHGKIIILVLIIGFMLSSCINNSEEYNIEDALKITVCVYDEDIDNYSFKELELNQTEILAPIGYDGMTNIPMLIEFDGGSVKVRADNKDIQLSTGQKYELWKSVGESKERIYGINASLPNKGYLSLKPSGIFMGCSAIDSLDEAGFSIDSYTNEEYYCEVRRERGYEYYLTVTAYNLNAPDSPAVTAKIKMVQLCETDLAPDSKEQLSIEIVSYEYSDLYKLS